MFETDACATCGGVFLDRDSIAYIVADGAQTAAAELLDAYPSDGSPVRSSTQVYVRCPVCQNTMNRTQFARGAKTIVDVCKTHGTFFDVGELPRVIDFVLHGGMERAAQKLRDEARERRQHALASARYQANRSAVSTFEQRDQDALQGMETFGELLAALLLR